MSIADKLLYLNDTKTALADAINVALSARGEAPLDADATFRSYAERLFYPGYLFGQGEQGGYCLPPNAGSYFTDTAGTTPAALTDAIALVNGEVGPDWAQGTATARPLWQSESGFAYLRFDLADDVLTTTLPAATYTVVLPTRQGIWIDSVTHAGGTFSVGPTSYTGGPDGILTALESDGVSKLVAPPLVIDRALSAGERNGLVQWYQARGAGRELELGAELNPNFDFTSWSDPTVPDGWIKGGTHIPGTQFVEQNANGMRLYTAGAYIDIRRTLDAGMYLLRIDVSSVTAGGWATGALGQGISGGSSGLFQHVVASTTSGSGYVGRLHAGVINDFVIRSYSIRRIQPKVSP